MNETGVQPVGFNLLIKVEKVSDQSAGGLILPDSAINREQHGNDKGKVIAMGEYAFSDWVSAKYLPKVGDVVIFEKYAGTVIQHRTEEGGSRQTSDYRLLDCKKIGAVIKEKENE